MIELSNVITLTDQDRERNLETVHLNCIGENPAYSVFQRMCQLKPWMSKMAPPDKEIILFTDKNKILTCPRGLLGLLDIDSPIIDLTSNVPIVGFTPTYKLRKDQEEAVDALLDGRFGILEAPTGSGKTLMGLEIANRLKQRTLFLVHTKSLLKQTIQEVKTKLGYDPGIIGDGKFIVKDFTVGTIQTLLRKDPSTYQDLFGLVIQDEAHHIPCNSFTKIINSFRAKYVYGLTATPQRTDKLDWVLYSCIGPKGYVIDRNSLVDKNAIVHPQIITLNTPFIPSKEYQEFDIVAHINALTKDNIRNAFLIQSVDNVLRQNPDCRPVILTERIAHAEYLAEQFRGYNPVLYHGSLSKKQAEEALKEIKLNSRLTISTYASIGEGFDVPLWDTLFITTPFTSPVRLIQIIGRVCRAAKGKDTAFVYDFVDVNDNVLYKRYLKRKGVYNSYFSK